MKQKEQVRQLIIILIKSNYNILLLDTEEKEITTLLVTVEPEETNFVAIDFSSVVSPSVGIHVKYETIVLAFLMLIILIMK